MLSSLMNQMMRQFRVVLSPIMLGFALTSASVFAVPVQVADWRHATPGGGGVALARTSTGDYVAVGIQSRSTIDPTYGAIMTLQQYASNGQPGWSVQVATTVAGLKPSKVLIDANDNIFVLANEADYNYALCALNDPTCTPGQIQGLFNAWWIVQKYSPNGSLIWQRRELKVGLVPVQGVAGPSGDLFVAFDPGSSAKTAVVQDFSGATGSTIWTASTPDGAKPGSLALSSSDSVLLAASGTFFGLSINEFAPDTGEPLTRTAYPAAAGYYAPGMAVGPQGEIAFTGKSADGLFLGLETDVRHKQFTLSTTPGAQGKLVAVDAQGRLTVAGTAPGSSGTNWLLARYDSAGSPLHAPVVIDRHASAIEEPSDLILDDGGAAYITGAAGPGTSTDPNATQAVTMRLASGGSIDWIASEPSGARGVGAALALDGSVAVVTAGDMTVLHYPVAAPTVPTALTLSATSVRGGKSVKGTVTLSTTAGAVVKLTSSHPAIAPVPSTLTVPGGASSASFTIKTSKVKINTGVTITATTNGVLKSASLLVLR